MTTSTAEFLEAHGYAAVSLVPTRLGHLLVDAVINDESARLLVDTGASETVIDEASAARLHVSCVGDAKTAVGCGLTGPAHRATLTHVRIGSVDLSEVGAYVVNLSQVNDAMDRPTGVRIDGVIGADFLKRGDAVIEYAQGTLHLRF